MPRPYRAIYFYCPVGRGDPTPPGNLAITAKWQGGVKTPPYKPAIKENQTGKNPNFRKFYRRSRKTGAGGRGVKKCVLTIF